MTAEEEGLFRQAAREALQQGVDVAMVGADDLPLFSVVRFEGSNAVAIVIPEHWHEELEAEAICHAILRQESKALAGQSLD
jgi:hypothetical protein